MPDQVTAAAFAAGATALVLAIRYRSRARANEPLQQTPSAEPAMPRFYSESSHKLWSLFARLYDVMMMSSPVEASMIGDHRFDDSLANVSLAAREELLHTMGTLLTNLESIPETNIGNAQLANYRFLREMLRLEIRARETFMVYEIPTTHLFGPHLYLPQLAKLQPLDTEEQQQAYMRRLRAFRMQSNMMITAFRAGIANGRTLPRRSVDALIEQLNGLVVNPVDTSPMFSTQVRDGDQLREIISEVVNPSLTSLRTFLEQTYAAHARENTGIHVWPNGKQIYDEAVAYFTSLPLTAQMVHDRGMQEVRKIEQEMAEVQKVIGFTGSLPEFIQHMKNDQQYAPKDGDAIIAEYREILERADSCLDQFFNCVPDRELWTVKPVEEYRAPAAPPAYFYPSDGTKPGTFYANTYLPETRPRFVMEAIALHEGVPGHALQIGIAQGLPDLPRLRQQPPSWCTGYVEGYALYCELLGLEMGFYTDPAANFGRLVTAQLRACRLVVDTGLHAYEWTRDDAIAFMSERVAMADADIESEVDRYMVLPGQACSYHMGFLKIVDLRKFAEAQLGDAFDLREFHKQLLCHGALPLQTLEDNIKEWVRSQQ